MIEKRREIYKIKFNMMKNYRNIINISIKLG